MLGRRRPQGNQRYDEDSSTLFYSVCSFWYVILHVSASEDMAHNRVRPLFIVKKNPTCFSNFNVSCLDMKLMKLQVMSSILKPNTQVKEVQETYNTHSPPRDSLAGEAVESPKESQEGA